MGQMFTYVIATLLVGMLLALVVAVVSFATAVWCLVKRERCSGASAELNAQIAELDQQIAELEEGT